jgi:hypothetical protein
MMLHYLLHRMTRSLSHLLLRHGHSAGHILVRWLPYYVAKFALMRSVRYYGAARLYRRACEATGKSRHAQDFREALKAVIRAPAKGYAALLHYDQQLWQWLQRMDAAGMSGRARAPSSTQQENRATAMQCAAQFNETRARRLDQALAASSIRLLLLSSGSQKPATPVLPEQLQATTSTTTTSTSTCISTPSDTVNKTAAKATMLKSLSATAVGRPTSE